MVGGPCSVGRNGSPDQPPPPGAPAHLARGSPMTAPLGALEQVWTVAGGDPGARAGESHRRRSDAADRRADRDRGGGGDRGRPGWRRVRSGGCGPGAAQSVAVDVRAAIAAFRASATCASTVGPRPTAAARCSGSIPPRTGGGSRSTRTCRTTTRATCASWAARRRASRWPPRSRKWKAQDLEDALTRRGLPAGMVRPRDGMARASAARAVAELPLLEIVRIGDRRPSRCRGRGPAARRRARARPHARHRGPRGRAHARLARGGRAARGQRAAPAEPPVPRHRFRARQAQRHRSICARPADADRCAR